MMYFDEIPENVLERQERIRALFRGETPERPLAYLCPMGYARYKTGEPFSDSRALQDMDYLAEFQAVGIKGLLDEDTDSTPVLWPRAGGVHFIDSVFGVELDVKTTGIWGEPLDCDIEHGELPHYDARGGLVPRVLEEIDFLRRRFGALPMTMPNMAGTLNAALNVLDNQRFLLLARRDVRAARRLLKHVSRAIMDVAEVLKGAIGDNIANGGPKFWLPSEYTMLAWCASQLVSEETYNDVVRPAEEMLLGDFSGGGVLHICGRCTHLIPMVRDMKLVRGVEIQNSPGGYDPSMDFEKYFDGLRDDQIIIITAGNIPPREILDISGGERVILNFNDFKVFREFRREYG